MKRISILLTCGLLWASFARAQDIRFQPTSAIWTVTKNTPWSQMNQTWVFRPPVPEITLYLFFTNRNTTSSHSFTLTVYQTPKPDVADRTNNTGFWVTDTQNGSCSPAAASSMSSCFVNTMFAAQIAIQVTGAASASGTPDTADLDIVMRTGTPGGTSPGGGLGVNLATISDVTVAGVSTPINQGSGQPQLISVAGGSTPILFPNVPYVWDGVSQLRLLQQPGTTASAQGAISVGGTNTGGSALPTNPVSTVNANMFLCGGTLTGHFCSYTPAQLGANAITLPASGNTANTNIIDLRGVRAVTLLSNCTQTYSVANSLYAEDGTTVLNSNPGAVVTAGQASSWNGISWSQESTGIKLIAGGTAGSASTVLYFPQRAISFFWVNGTATAGTCTARLFVTY